ncbi:hypothetical protein [Pseudomonas sp. S3E12]|uniref:hypothetical protein n=1 Tax=Pseudomonas sp. S3E12 TaxID=1873126 RepID=UPI00081C1101|nr:hypothetical protein [Pseudomonas sp. S3E12]OCW24046.1 hypothetical protein BB029_13115 [Pseudomonas sp. S3E12]
MTDHHAIPIQKLTAPLHLTFDSDAVSALNDYLNIRALTEVADWDDSEAGINLYLAYQKAAYELAEHVASIINKTDIDAINSSKS